MNALKNILSFFIGCKKEDGATTSKAEVSQKSSNPHDSGGCCGHCGGQDK